MNVKLSQQAAEKQRRSLITIKEEVIGHLSETRWAPQQQQTSSCEMRRKNFSIFTISFFTSPDTFILQQENMGITWNESKLSYGRLSVVLVILGKQAETQLLSTFITLRLCWSSFSYIWKGSKISRPGKTSLCKHQLWISTDFNFFLHNFQLFDKSQHTLWKSTSNKRK